MLFFIPLALIDLEDERERGREREGEREMTDKSAGHDPTVWKFVCTNTLEG